MNNIMINWKNRQKVEDEIIKIWEKILNVHIPSTNCNFLELGGDSLNAIQLVNMLVERFDIHLPISFLFENPTIKLMADFVFLEVNKIAKK